MKLVFNILLAAFTIIGVVTLFTVYYNRHIKKRYVQIIEEI
jgi:hypothetical protein